MLFLLFNFSNCLNALKNTFAKTGTKTYCKNDGEEGSFSLTGQWENEVNIPDSLSFDLVFEDGTKFSCSFNKDTPNDIVCPTARGKKSTKVMNQYMDQNEEYFLQDDGKTVTYKCSSLYVYINILLSLILLFILF